MRAGPDRRTDAQAGFSLAELLITMFAALLVLSAALGLFEAFNSGAAKTHRLIDAQDSARNSIGNVVRVLRNAGAPAPTNGAAAVTVLRAQPNDLIFLSTAWPGESNTGATNTHVERYCLDTATQTLWFDGFRAGTSGSSAAGGACPSTSAGWVHRAAAQKLVNSSANPVFQYGSTNPVRTVGVSLRVEGGTSLSTRPFQLTSGGALRGALAPQVGPSNVGVGSCEAGKALLTLDLSAGGATTNGATMTATGAIGAGPGKIFVNASNSAASVTLTVTNGLGLQTIFTKSVSC